MNAMNAISMSPRRPSWPVLAAFLLAATLVLPHAAAGQTPPPTPASGQPPAPPPPPEREGSAELAFVGTSGNSSTDTIGIGGELIYRPAPWETKLKIAYIRNEADDVVSAQSFVATFRAQRPITPRLSGYGQYGYQRDRFAGIVNRNAIEAGLAYALVAQPRHTLVIDGGVGYANEHRVLPPNLSTATLGGGFVYTLKLSKTSEISEDGHAISSLARGEDWRYVNAIAVSAKLTTLLSLKVSNTIRYLHAPTPTFKNTDTMTAAALVAKF
jgi:putative salt-induced outer membrane protein